MRDLLESNEMVLHVLNFCHLATLDYVCAASMQDLLGVLWMVLAKAREPPKAVALVKDEAFCILAVMLGLGPPAEPPHSPQVQLSTLHALFVCARDWSV